MDFGIELLGIKACLIASLYPFVIYFSKHFGFQKIVQSILAILFLSLSFYLKSRMLFVEIICPTAVHVLPKKIKNKTLFLLGLPLAAMLCFLNIDSLIGRIFIWKIIFANFSTIPFGGLGMDAFKTFYANWQSAYFNSHQVWTRYHLVADSPSFAFNEVLHFYVEFGVVAIVLFSLFLFLNFSLLQQKQNAFIRPICESNLIVLLFSLVSYPLHSFWIWGILLCNHLLLLGGFYTPIRWICLGLGVGMALCLSFFYFQNKQAKEDWHYAQSIPISYQEDKMNAYRQVYPSLKTNPYYLYDFCRYLISEKSIDSAINILSMNGIYFNQYEKNILLGDAYIAKNNFLYAVFSYQKANTLIPTRLIPISNLMKISMLQKDTAGARLYAQKIISLPLKVESKIGSQIKKEASMVLNPPIQK